MSIKVHSLAYLHEQGPRPYSEDFMFPGPGNATREQQVFLVCDGVGGSARGDFASRTVSTVIGQALSGMAPNKASDLALDALQMAEKELDHVVSAHPEMAGSATTLTLAILQEKGITVGWVGDSRVLHIRDGSILFQTADHSLVGELLRRGLVTEEEARTHPKRNVITRAVSGAKQPATMDLHWVDDVRDGDYLVLCTDGILEAVSDADWMEILGKNPDCQEVADIVKAKCSAESGDNFAMYILRLAVA